MMSGEMVERAAKAVHEALSQANIMAYLDMPSDTPTIAARAVLNAMKYEDWDEDRFITAAAGEGLDVVSLICAYDNMLTAALAEDTPDAG